MTVPRAPGINRLVAKIPTFAPIMEMIIFWALVRLLKLTGSVDEYGWRIAAFTRATSMSLNVSGASRLPVRFLVSWMFWWTS